MYYQNSLCYGIEQMSTGYAAIFNHRKCILNKIVDLLNAGYNVCRNSSDKNMIFVKGKTKYMSVAKYLYCLYHKQNASFSNQIRHKNKRIFSNIEDCRKNNIYMGGASVFLDRKNNCVVALSNAKTHRDEFEPLPILVDILNSEKIVLQWRDNGRLECFVKGETDFNASDLAYLSYYEDLTMENYIEKIKEFKKYKNDNDFSIEHLDGDFNCHYKYNLALVPISLNSKKNDKISQIKEPHFMTVVTNGEFFKILIGNFEEDLIIAVDKRYITKDFKTVVDLLYAYLKLYPERIDKEEAKSRNERLINKRFFAEMLAKEPNENFVSLDEFLATMAAQDG